MLLVGALLCFRDAPWFDLYIVIASDDPLRKPVFISDCEFLSVNVYLSLNSYRGSCADCVYVRV